MFLFLRSVHANAHRLAASLIPRDGLPLPHPIVTCNSFDPVNNFFWPFAPFRNSEIGEKAKSVVIVTSNSRSSKFVTSFNNVQFRDTGLNCSLYKSKVHKDMDV